jgi:hypothetical protein
MALLFPFLLGGKNKSKQLYEEITEITTNLLNKITTNLKNSATGDQYSRQIVEVNMDDSVFDCGIQIIQTSIITCNILLEAKSEISSEMSAELVNEIMTKVEQKLEQTNKGVNIPSQQNISDIATRIRTILNTNIENIIETNIDNILEFKQGSEQAIIFKAKGLRMTKCPKSGVGLQITQNSLLDGVAKNVSSSVLDTIVSLEQMNQITRDIQQSVKQKNEGIDASMSLISSICIVIILAAIAGGPFIIPRVMDIKDDNTKVFIVVFCCVLLLCCSLSCSLSSGQATKNSNNENTWNREE